jgi:hypothetical protein
VFDFIRRLWARAVVPAAPNRDIVCAELPAPLNSRRCQGRAWKEAFPAVPSADVREFLHHFVDSFDFRADSGLAFRPDDCILGIYRLTYTNRWMSDDLEMENLAAAIEQAYGWNSARWHEGLTLGQLFQEARDARGRLTEMPAA